MNSFTKFRVELTCSKVWHGGSSTFMQGNLEIYINIYSLHIMKHQNMITFFYFFMSVTNTLLNLDLGENLSINLVYIYEIRNAIQFQSGFICEFEYISKSFTGSHTSFSQSNLKEMKFDIKPNPEEIIHKKFKLNMTLAEFNKIVQYSIKCVSPTSCQFGNVRIDTFHFASLFVVFMVIYAIESLAFHELHFLQRKFHKNNISYQRPQFYE